MNKPNSDSIQDFEIISSEGFNTIQLSGKITLASAHQFEEQIPELSKNAPKKNIIVNCQNLSELSDPWIRVLLILNSKLKAINKNLRLINVEPPIKKVLKIKGLENSLIVAASLNVALQQFGLIKEKPIDVNFINPFLSATVNVLKVQCSTEAKALKPFSRRHDDKYQGDISGVIGLVSDAFSGSVVISFPSATFLKIMSRMLGEDLSTVTKLIEDGAGELTNIIFGQAKVILNEKGYGIKTAIPSVVSGESHHVEQLSHGPRIAIPFETDVGPFYIEICVVE